MFPEEELSCLDGSPVREHPEMAFCEPCADEVVFKEEHGIVLSNLAKILKAQAESLSD
jgi:hypothetical protein